MTATAAQQTVAVTLPPGWRRVHTKKLLENAITGLTASAVADALAETDREQVREVLAGLVRMCRDDGVVLVAIRIRNDEKALDQLTLAVPGSAAVKDARSAGAAQPLELTEELNLDGMRAIAHRPAPDYASTVGPSRRSVVQLVFLLPDSDRGAILTIASSVHGAEDRLQRDAVEVVRSLSLTSP